MAITIKVPFCPSTVAGCSVNFVYNPTCSSATQCVTDNAPYQLAAPGPLPQGDTLFGFMEACILRLGQLGKAGTAKNYQSTLNSVRRFRRGEDLPVASMDHILIEDYYAYLRKEGLAPNSMSFYLRILRAVYNRAVAQGLTPDNRPFRTVSSGMERTRKRAISLNEIKRIQELDLSWNLALAFARDVFLFSFLCRGMSFIDMAFLKKTDIKDGILFYRRHKTNQPLQVRMVRQIRAIIDRHSDKESPYLLPIIAIHASSPSDGRKQYDAGMHRINHALKTIGRMLKLPMPLTTYVARHSWASIAKSKHISVNVISDALGHDSIATTQTYLASIDTSAIDRANELVIKDLRL